MHIDVIIKRPGQIPHHTSISNSLKNLQGHVGGYIEAVTLPSGIVVICNEDGRIVGLPHNCTVDKITFVGTIIFAGIQGEEFGDIPLDYQTFKKKYKELFLKTNQ